MTQTPDDGHVHVHVAGSVITERELAEAIQRVLAERAEIPPYDFGDGRDDK